MTENRGAVRQYLDYYPFGALRVDEQYGYTNERHKFTRKWGQSRLIFEIYDVSTSCLVWLVSMSEMKSAMYSIVPTKKNGGFSSHSSSSLWYVIMVWMLLFKRPVVMGILTECFYFGIKQARAAIFAGSFFVLLFISNHIPLFGLARYDFLFLAAVAIQVALYITKLETKDEVKVIFLFHIIGLVLELYKTNPAIGSWSYPEPGVLMIATVPLYSGFMYAAVGSYISQAWKVLRLEITHYSNYPLSLALGALIYLNFFTNHFLYDFRLPLIVAVFWFFWSTRVYFTVLAKRRWMYLNIGFLLIAFFIWIAENISTYLGAWKYPDQIHTWSVVSTQKITSWFLMVIISFIVVAYLKHFKKEVLKRT